MKKLVLIVSLIGLLVFGGCGSKNKEAFLEQMDQYSGKNNLDFTMKINDFELIPPDDTDIRIKAVFEALAKEIRNMSIDGSLQVNQKKKLSGLDMNFELLGATFNPEIILDDQTRATYINGDFLVKMVSVLNGDNRVDTSSVTGKYIQQTREEELNPVYFVNIFNYLEEENFSKKDGKITCTVTKNELQKIYEENVDFKDEKEKNDFMNNFKYLKKITVTATTNPEGGAVKTKIDATYKKDGGTSKVKATIKVTPSKKTTKISLPTEDNIVSMEQLPNVVLPATTPETTMTLSEEEFQNFMNELSSSITMLSVEEKNLVLEVYGEYLTPDQLERLTALLG